MLAGSLALATLAAGRARAQSQALAPASPPTSAKPGPFRLEEAARFPSQATGVAAQPIYNLVITGSAHRT
jgi:hypothetical protein